MIEKKKIVLFGSGSRAQIIIDKIPMDQYEVISIWDNKVDNWGKVWNSIPINKPGVDKEFDILIVASLVYFEEIYKQLTEELGVPKEKIENAYYFQKLEMLDRYQNSNGDLELESAIDYLRNHSLHIFQSDFVEKYKQQEYDIFFDEEHQLFYVLFEGKKMYFSKSYNSKEKVRKYYRSILTEQDAKSPHCYFKPGYKVNEGNVVVDAGVAEGNFSLSIIEKVSKVYLVEADKDWADALKLTFSPWKDKVEIVQKFLGDKDGDETITIDTLLDDKKVDVIKMDIEGAEMLALNGASNTIEKNEDLMVIACCYHKSEHCNEITSFLNQRGYMVDYAKGYMFFPYYEDNSELRRGLLFAKKKMNVVLYGTGKRARILKNAIKCLPNINITAVVDGNNDIKDFDGIDVKSPAELKKLQYDLIFIGSSFFQEIKEGIIKNEWVKDNNDIVDGLSYFERIFFINQYAKYRNLPFKKVIGNEIKKQKIVIYTAMFGNYDDLIEPEFIDENIDYVCFTDNPSIQSDIWKVVLVEEKYEDSNRAAKIYKILPHRYFSEYDYSIWVDASYIIHKDLRELLIENMGEEGILFFPHNLRDSAYEDAKVCIQNNLDKPDLIEAQMERYKKE